MSNLRLFVMHSCKIIEALPVRARAVVCAQSASTVPADTVAHMYAEYLAAFPYILRTLLSMS